MRRLLIRVATGTAAAALAAGLAGTATPASAATSCQTSFTSYAAVRAGSTGSPAGAVQCLLSRAGYRTTVDRSFSTADATVLRTFQRAHRLGATGQADGRTWAALIAVGHHAALSTGSRGADVVALQLSLRALGHPELPGTSYYGARTTAAVKALQGSLGWRRTGATGAQEWAALQLGGQRPATTTPVASTSAKGAAALAFAKQQLGEPYRWGAAGPSAWDCSGLTMKAWQAAGVTLPHNAAAQSRLGRAVARADLRPGDLVFYYSPISHVALYAGNGQVIHASRPGKPVAYITLGAMPYAGARRPA